MKALLISFYIALLSPMVLADENLDSARFANVSIPHDSYIRELVEEGRTEEVRELLKRGGKGEFGSIASDPVLPIVMEHASDPMLRKLIHDRYATIGTVLGKAIDAGKPEWRERLSGIIRQIVEEGQVEEADRWLINEERADILDLYKYKRIGFPIVVKHASEPFLEELAKQNPQIEHAFEARKIVKEGNLDKVKQLLKEERGRVKGVPGYKRYEEKMAGMVVPAVLEYAPGPTLENLLKDKEINFELMQIAGKAGNQKWARRIKAFVLRSIRKGEIETLKDLLKKDNFDPFHSRRYKIREMLVFPIVLEHASEPMLKALSNEFYRYLSLLEIAIRTNVPYFVERLISAGVDVKQGEYDLLGETTPLEELTENSNSAEIAKILHEAEAKKEIADLNKTRRLTNKISFWAGAGIATAVTSTACSLIFQ